MNVCKVSVVFVTFASLLTFALVTLNKTTKDYASESRHLLSRKLQFPFLPSSRAARYTCPEVGADPVEIPHNSNVELDIVPSGTLCTLVLRTIKCTGLEVFGVQLLPGVKTEFITPVARSYNGNEWEAAAGQFSTQTFDCDGVTCSTKTKARPSLEFFPFVFYKYELISFSDDRDLTGSERAARFFEQSTFGATTQELSSWEFSGPTAEVIDLLFLTNAAFWLRNQFALTPTSHRARFRELASTRALRVKPMGSIQHACDPNTIWHSYSFRVKDVTGLTLTKYVTITNTTEGTYLMSMNNVTRTEVASIGFEDYNATFDFPVDLSVCDVDEEIGGNLELEVDGECRSFIGGNPPINITSESSPRPDYIITKTPEDFSAFSEISAQTRYDEYFLSSGISDTSCDFLHVGAHPVYIDFGEGADPRWLSFDPRIKLLENTLGNPIQDGGGSQELLGSRCSNVARNFLNAESCVLSQDVETCSSAYAFPDAEITLSASTLFNFFLLTENYVYAIADLRVEKSPCEANTFSRWQKIDNFTQCVNDTIVTDEATVDTLKELLLNAEEDQSIFSTETGWLRDIKYEAGTCSVPLTTPNSTVSTTRSFVMIPVEDECWELVHPEYYSVYDMSPWVTRHPGGSEKITQFIENNEVFLQFPSDHEMERWEMNKELFPFVGRYNGTVLFQDLPISLQQDNVAEEFGAAGQDADGLIVVCGSVNEIPNDLSKGYTGFAMSIEDDYEDKNSQEKKDQRNAVWLDTVLSAPDQLRQRMAWALSQLFAISPDDVVEDEQTEGFTYYYDIFVRNAFGTYFDVLKEVSYSSHMAEMLTFIRSKSPAYILKTTGFTAYADENYAREIMQLFTIGTIMLNMDGTSILDDSGDEILTYSNEQIESFARAWTGFSHQAQRGNIELSAGAPNRIDPMFIVADWRDVFPKVDLFGGHIGDGFPLCEDIPEKSFLRKGAIYRLLGSKSSLELHENPPSTIDPTVKKVTLSSDSALYNILCNATVFGGSDCNFQSIVTLDENLECNGQECLVDTVRQIEVTEGIYFEYVRQPCVELSYFSDAKTIINRGTGMCANPGTAVAGEACCISETSMTASQRNCEFINERMTYFTASERCENIGLQLCPHTSLSCPSECCDYTNYYFWRTDSCTLRVKVVEETGDIGIVHKLDDSVDVWDYFNNDSVNYFQVNWEDGDYPKPSNNCDGGGGQCEVLDDSCICDVMVEDTEVFSSAPSTNDLSQLFIGSVSPDTFDEGTYDEPITDGDIKIYLRSDSSSYDINTIFEIQDGNETKYFKNMKSTVKVGEFSLRNPPHFMNFVESDARDAHHETDAVLKQYLKHPNVPPFVSTFFLRRFGASNPSPRYIEAVATAFKNGIFVANDMTFGTGEFGDLKAMIAAILLDREALTLVLDYDPSHGALREPLLKVVALMRSMEYRPNPDSPDTNYMLSAMTSKIDQMVYDLKTVFSFFRSDFAPIGRVRQASLVAPEGQRYLAPYVVGQVNGLLSMVKYGLSTCNQGFGASGSCIEGGSSSGPGNLTFSPSDPSNAEVVVNELATLLTSGRLNEKSREIISEEFSKAEDEQAGLRIAQQLMLTTPEFHSTSLTNFSGEPRPDLVTPPPSDREFKAVIYLHFFGGLDSYNMIVPHSGCLEKNLYDEYKEVRGNIALDNETLLLIDTGGESQPCDYFGIHYDLPALQDLYNDGDLLFFTNTGYLSQDVNKTNWNRLTKGQLFGHYTGMSDAQELDPLKAYDGTGIFGRMADVLTANGYKTGAISVASQNSIMVGEPQQSPPYMCVDSRGVKKVFPGPSISDLKEKVADLNNATSLESGMFGETWSDTLQLSIYQTELLQAALENATLFNETLFPASSLGRQFKMIAKAIKGKDDLGIDRGTFFMRIGGFDTHFDQEEILGSRFEDISSSIDGFVQEMKEQGMWQNVVLVTSSDFARTITPNGGDGTDHAWGGHYFAMGGSMRGGRILGEYPSDLTSKGPYNIGRGRMIPTTSWDAVWHGVAEWFGIKDDAGLDKVLPNRGKFSRIYNEIDLFG